MLWCTHQYHHTKPPFRPMGKLEDLPPPIAPHRRQHTFCLALTNIQTKEFRSLTERKGRGSSTSLEQQRILQWQLDGVHDFFCIDSNLPMSSNRTLGRDNNDDESRRFDPSGGDIAMLRCRRVHATLPQCPGVYPVVPR